MVPHYLLRFFYSCPPPSTIPSLKPHQEWHLKPFQEWHLPACTLELSRCIFTVFSKCVRSLTFLENCSSLGCLSHVQQLLPSPACGECLHHSKYNSCAYQTLIAGSQGRELEWGGTPQMLVPIMPSWSDQILILLKLSRSLALPLPPAPFIHQIFLGDLQRADTLITRLYHLLSYQHCTRMMFLSGFCSGCSWAMTHLKSTFAHI